VARDASACTPVVRCDRPLDAGRTLAFRAEQRSGHRRVVGASAALVLARSD